MSQGGLHTQLRVKAQRRQASLPLLLVWQAYFLYAPRMMFLCPGELFQAFTARAA